MKNIFDYKNTTPPHLVMAGMSCLDQVSQVEIFPPEQSRTPVTFYSQGGGGPAATAAVAASYLGAEVKLLTLHGNDAAADYLEREFAAYGVTPINQRYQGVRTPVSTVIVSPDGERYIFPYRDTRLYQIRGGWDLSCMEARPVVLIDNRYLHLSEAVLTRAEHLGLAVVADFGDAAHWSLAGRVSHLLVSEECARQRCGTSDPTVILKQLKQFKTQVVGITFGVKGFYYDDGEGIKHVPAFATDVMDTTGAGDVFHGAYAYALALDLSTEACACFAAAAAALSCRGLGRSAIPSLQDVVHLLASRPGIESFLSHRS